MRGKRSKQYRKLMQQYSLHFGFREPYQVLLDGAVLEDAARFKMDFVTGLAKALHGQIKPMLTTCSIRHLSNRNPQNSPVMEHARLIERRRCNHHELDDPLSEYDCLTSVVDPKGTKNNKHKLVVATQDDKLRRSMRSIPGVPLIYLKRSVMVVEPMAGATEAVRESEERSKFKVGLRGFRGGGSGGPSPNANTTLKRRRDDEIAETTSGGVNVIEGNSNAPQSGELGEAAPQAKKRRKGPSGPNPLSAMKAKSKKKATTDAEAPSQGALADIDSSQTPGIKIKRKRRHKAGQNTSAAQDSPGENVVAEVSD